MSTTLSATFETRRVVEMTVERLVQEHGVERTDVFIAAESDKNSAGEEQAGSDRNAGEPSFKPRGDAPLHGAVSVSVDIEHDVKAAKVREAFAEFHADDVSEA